MSRTHRPLLTIATLSALLAGGCASDAPSSPSTASVTPRYVPPADRYVRSVVLDFRSPTDLAFIDSPSEPLVVDGELRTTAVTVRLDALLRGRAFPGPWDLIGVRVRSSAGGPVTATLLEGEQTRGSAMAMLAANAPAQTLWIETAQLAATRPASASGDALTLKIRAEGGEVRIVDVVLAQGRTVVTDIVVPQSGERFFVERRGLAWHAELNGRPLVSLPAAPFVAEGFALTEANAIRALFSAPDGSTACVDRQGRVIRVAANGSGGSTPPAAIDVVTGSARLVRNAPGDRDNDGFDESRGTFTLRASGDRFDVRLQPSGGSPDEFVVLDIEGVPADGTASVWVQGETATDLVHAGGRQPGESKLVVVLPIRVERAVGVNVRIR